MCHHRHRIDILKMITSASSIEDAIAAMQPAVPKSQKTLVGFFSTKTATAPKPPGSPEKLKLLQPSSAAAERVFSQLSQMFTPQQMKLNQKWIFICIALRFNKRRN